MSRTTGDAEITTRAARERLRVRHDPYWRAIEGGLALGYRKGVRGGVWMARLWAAGGYRKATLGRADDTIGATLTRTEATPAADDVRVLDFRQAQAKAQSWARRLHRIAAGLEPEAASEPARPYTVADAVSDYLSDYAARGGKALDRTQTAAQAHILPAFENLPVGRLTRGMVKSWHRGLAALPARLRSRRGEQKHRYTEGDPEAKRRRRASANRVLTVLKAALNHARADTKVTCLPDAWTAIRAFREADKAKVRYLLDDEITRLVNACPVDFRELVIGALLTGCRYGELATMRAADFDPRAGTILIGRSKSGKPRHVALTDEGRKFFTQMTAGRAGASRLFERNGVVKQATRNAPAETARVPWRKSDQFRFMREACAAAQITPSASFHELRHTYGSRLAMRGVPMGVIAQQLGHADTRMSERHYAHMAPSYVAEAVRQSFGTLGIVAEAPIAPLRLTARVGT